MIRSGPGEWLAVRQERVENTTDLFKQGFDTIQRLQKLHQDFLEYNYAHVGSATLVKLNSIVFGKAPTFRPYCFSKLNVAPEHLDTRHKNGTGYQTAGDPRVRVDAGANVSQKL